MATVYGAHDLRHARDAAVKVLHPELAAVLMDDAEFWRRFKGEEWSKRSVGSE